MLLSRLRSAGFIAALLLGPAASAQTITTIAGNGSPGYNGDDPTQTALTASIWFPVGLALDPAGNLYVADSSNHRVRRITPEGVITTVAGDGSNPPTLLANPTALALDSAGNLYIADTFYHRIR